MLCRVQVRSEQVSLESFVHFPDIDGEFVPPLRCHNRGKSLLHCEGFVHSQGWGYQPASIVPFSAAVSYRLASDWCVSTPSTFGPSTEFTRSPVPHYTD